MKLDQQAGHIAAQRASVSPKVLVVRELARRSFHNFVRLAWPHIMPGVPFVDGLHIQAACEHLQAAAEGRLRRLIINMPPRMSKSTLVSVLFPAWVWGPRAMPQARFLTASYAQPLATRDAVATRRLLESDWFKTHWPLEMAGDQNQKTRYENAEGGYRIATSVGGAVIGEGGDFCIVDDAHNPRGGFLSDNARVGVLDWFRQTWSTRLNDPKRSVSIVMGQRLAETDLTGMLLTDPDLKQDWEGAALVLPMEYEGEEHRAPPTALGWIDPRTVVGELLSSGRFGAPEVAALKRSLGVWGTASQLQQHPSPLTGLLFRKEAWRFWRDSPGAMQTVMISMDAAFKGLSTSDPVAIQAWGARGVDTFLLDQVHGRMTFTEAVAALRAFRARWPQAVATVVEEAANGAAIVDVLRNTIPGIMAVPPRGGKIARAQAWAPRADAGQVFLPDPQQQPWVNEFIKEHAGFPTGDHDDMVDAASQAHAWLSANYIPPAVVVMTAGKDSQWKDAGNNHMGEAWPGMDVARGGGNGGDGGWFGR